jgi:hypothetical protein
MRGAIGAIAFLLAVSAFPQEVTYTPAENPFQAEYPFTPGQPIVLRMAVAGVQLDTLTLSAPTPESPDAKVSCTLALDGSNQAGEKVTLSSVLLLEDANGKALERLTMTPFRLKAGKPFSRSETLPVQGSSLLSAGKVYVFLKVD